MLLNKGLRVRIVCVRGLESLILLTTVAALFNYGVRNFFFSFLEDSSTPRVLTDRSQVLKS